MGNSGKGPPVSDACRAYVGRLTPIKPPLAETMDEITERQSMLVVDAERWRANNPMVGRKGEVNRDVFSDYLCEQEL